jgi:hypothetical protein
MIPSVVIDDFNLLVNAISFSEPIEDVKEITLPYSENSFVIDFVALSYKSSNDNQFAYN